MPRRPIVSLAMCDSVHEINNILDRLVFSNSQNFLNFNLLCVTPPQFESKLASFVLYLIVVEGSQEIMYI